MTDFPARARRTGGGLPRAIIAAAVGAALLFAIPATAQILPYGQEDEPLPPPTISRMLLRRGYEPVGRPRFQGDVYMVQALSPSGARVRLMVDAYNGSIIRSTRLDEDLGPVRPRGREYLDREVDLDLLDDVPPRASRPQPQFEDETLRTERARPHPGDGPARAQRPQAEPERKAARNEPPGRAPEGAAPSRRGTQPAAPAAAPAAPGPVVDKPKQEQPAAPKPAATAAAPAPAPKQDAPAATPPAPPAPPPVEAAKPEPAKAAPAKTAEKSGEEKPATAGPSQPVRVIEGVTPIIPQKQPGEGQAAND